MIYIALHEDKDRKVGLLEIARHQKIPHHFLSKILQLLVKHGFLGSTKGKNGGFYLMKRPAQINLLQLVNVIDGDDIWERCALGLKRCSDKTPCPVHKEFKNVKSGIRKTLTEKSLSDICEDLREKKTLLYYR